eukprot:gene23532-9055_t
MQQHQSMNPQQLGQSVNPLQRGQSVNPLQCGQSVEPLQRGQSVNPQEPEQDDLLFVSTSKAAAEAVLAKMVAGFPEMAGATMNHHHIHHQAYPDLVFPNAIARYGCSINKNKTQLNFEVVVDGCALHPDKMWHSADGAAFIKWCGLLLNSQTLEIQADYTRYCGEYIATSLTVPLTNKPVPLISQARGDMSVIASMLLRGRTSPKLPHRARYPTSQGVHRNLPHSCRSSTSQGKTVCSATTVTAGSYIRNTPSQCPLTNKQMRLSVALHVLRGVHRNLPHSAAHQQASAAHPQARGDCLYRSMYCGAYIATSLTVPLIHKPDKTFCTAPCTTGRTSQPPSQCRSSTSQCRSPTSQVRLSVPLHVLWGVHRNLPHGAAQ